MVKAVHRDLPGFDKGISNSVQTATGWKLKRFTLDPWAQPTLAGDRIARRVVDDPGDEPVFDPLERTFYTLQHVDVSR